MPRLFYLVPPVTLLMADAFFCERLTLTVLVGMALTVPGVALGRPASAAFR